VPFGAKKKAAVEPSPESSSETNYRVASVPESDLVATLRDGSRPLEERVRVAEALALQAPEELERFAAETADPELEKRLVPLARQPRS
jgi:hypothetical protein